MSLFGEILEYEKSDRMDLTVRNRSGGRCAYRSSARVARSGIL